MRMKNVAVHSIQSKSSEISNVNVDTTSVIEKFLNKYFLMEWKEQVEDLLKLKSKASKYNLRARCEEQLDIIKKLKMNLKRILTEVKPTKPINAINTDIVYSNCRERCKANCWSRSWSRKIN